jgi:hypothetical protein
MNDDELAQYCLAFLAFKATTQPPPAGWVGYTAAFAELAKRFLAGRETKTFAEKAKNRVD